MKLETIEIDGKKTRQATCEKCRASVAIFVDTMSEESIDAMLKGPMSQHVCDQFAGYTPGPWTWNERGELLAKGFPGTPSLGDVESWGEPENYDLPATVRIVQTDSGAYGPRGADAKLIAAAPTLLFHERVLRDYLERLINASEEFKPAIRRNAQAWLDQNPGV